MTRDEKDVLIERLTTKWEKEKNILLVSLETAIKEIERLKQETRLLQAELETRKAMR